MKKQIEFLGITDKSTVYSKFSFAEIWNFINPNEEKTYEIRIKSSIKDDKLYHPKIIGKRFNIPYHFTGVFITNAHEYKKVACYCVANKLTAYLSINPKRKSYHGNDGLKFKTLNGKKQSELGIFNILIDFDPTKKLKTKIDNTEETAYRKAKLFLKENTNIKKYMLISSGNGAQLRIPLDSPILLPKDEYDDKNRFMETKEIEIYSRLLKTAMGKIIKKYSSDLIIVDITGFELARVGRLPFSINFKRNKKKYCGPIEIVDEGENTGLHDFIKSFYDKIELEENKYEQYKAREISDEFKYTIDNIQDSKLVKFLIKDELPSGGRNNILFFQFKLLLSNLNISFKEEKIKALVRDMERVQKHHFPLNPCTGTFHPEAIINYCIEWDIKPIYPVLYYKERKRNLGNLIFKEVYEDFLKIHNGFKTLPDGKNITRKIIKYCELNKLCFTNKKLLRIDLKKLFVVITNDCNDVTKLSYLIESKVLKDILEKT